MNFLVDTSNRSSEIEIMDDFTMDGVMLRDTLDKLEIINRLLGGNKVTIKGLKELLKNKSKNKIITIVDLGCGDFNVGKNFIDDCNKYVACDISSIILERNKQNHQYNNIEYNQINIAEDKLPKGDLAFVRQVLQHLSNREIKKFADYLNKVKPYKHLLITEGLPFEKGFKPNIDKPLSKYL